MSDYGRRTAWHEPRPITPSAATLAELDALLTGIEQRMDKDDLDVAEPGIYGAVLEALKLVAKLTGGTP